MGFFLSLLIIIAIQNVITFILQLLGVPYFYINLVVDLVLAFVFTYYNRYRFQKKNPFKDIDFQVSFCIWFSVLTLIDTIWLI